MIHYKKFSSNKVIQIQYGLIGSCIIFTIPIVILFYFMFKFRSEAINFAKNERDGAYQIENIIEGLNAHRKDKIFINRAYVEIRHIGDYSQLILDPDLDSFYLMYAVTIEIPKMLKYTMEYLDPDTSTQKSNLIIPVIKTLFSDLERSVSISQKEDYNYYGSVPQLKSSEFLELKRLFEEEMKFILQSESNTIVLTHNKDPLKNTYQYWALLDKALIQALNNRIEYIKRERLLVTIFTLSIWLLSLLLTLYLLKVITERQNVLERENKEKSASLITTSKMSALGEMAGGLAHEINTPLATIRLRAEQMEDLILDPNFRVEFLKKNVEAIKTTTDRITKIINGLRFFSRQQSNDTPTVCFIKSIIEDTLSFCHERFKNHGIDLEIIKGDVYESTKVQCRPVEISQVLLNLLNNAYDAIGSLEKKWIQILVQESETNIEVSITDSGPGIPPEILSKIMQPFFTTKEIGKGTGLGLSISVGIMKNHGGELLIDNSVSNTRFVLRFPKVASTLSLKAV